MWARTAVVCLVTLCAGCASAPARRDRTGITLGELLAGAALGVAQDSPVLVAEKDVLAVSAEMQDFLRAHVAQTASRLPRLRQLGHAIIRDSAFRLKYDETTRTASATFHTHQGNCLSFSNMFVAMARQVGLSAHFQEVDTPPDWSFRDESFVLNRHVNVVVDLGKEGEHVVDINMEDFRTSYDRRTISDARALAHYYNNVAVERMQADDTASALGYFRKAVANDPAFSPAWTNLGILYLRKGHTAHAEAAYLEALKADAGDLAAVSNLAGLYDRLGDRDQAAVYRNRAIDHRQRNPYYRFRLAREAFMAQNYDAAIGHLKYALSQKRDEDQFCFLLGMCYMKKGDEQTGRRWLSRAEELAATDAQRRKYSSKIEMLLSGPPAEPDFP
jgi:Flp pilus assembly protein TadD